MNKPLISIAIATTSVFLCQAQDIATNQVNDVAEAHSEVQEESQESSTLDNHEVSEEPSPSTIDDYVAGIGPSTYESHTSVSNVRSYAFAECRALEHVNLPNVTHLGKCAFLGCINLTDVAMPSVTNMSNCGGMFGGCAKLASVRLPLVSLQEAKKSGMPWLAPAKATVYYLQDGTFDRNGNPVSP